MRWYDGTGIGLKSQEVGDVKQQSRKSHSKTGIKSKGRTFTLHGIAVFNSHPPVLNQFSKGPFWLPGLALVATSPFLASSIGKKTVSGLGQGPQLHFQQVLIAILSRLALSSANPTKRPNKNIAIENGLIKIIEIVSFPIINKLYMVIEGIP